MYYYLVLKSNEYKLLIYNIIQMNLKIIIVNGRSKEKIYMIYDYIYIKF